MKSEGDAAKEIFRWKRLFDSVPGEIIIKNLRPLFTSVCKKLVAWRAKAPRPLSGVFLLGNASCLTWGRILVVCDPSMYKLWATKTHRDIFIDLSRMLTDHS